MLYISLIFPWTKGKSTICKTISLAGPQAISCFSRTSFALTVICRSIEFCPPQTQLKQVSVQTNYIQQGIFPSHTKYLGASNLDHQLCCDNHRLTRVLTCALHPHCCPLSAPCWHRWPGTCVCWVLVMLLNNRFGQRLVCGIRVVVPMWSASLLQCMQHPSNLAVLASVWNSAGYIVRHARWYTLLTIMCCTFCF